MRPLRLTLENFLSYRGEHQVDFDGVSLAVLSGPNGSGKSSLIDAMRFALFGHARGGLDGVVTEGQDACRVEFTFALGEDHYLVSRQRSRKGSGKTLLSFQTFGDGNPIVLDGKSIAETQQRIEQTLHLTDDLFTMTACANQGNAAAFSQARPAERKAVLGEILGLGMWEQRAQAARQMARDQDARIQSTTQQLGRARERAAEADGLQEQITDLNCEIEHAEEAVAEHESQLADAQEARVNILRDREADRARRHQLDDLAGRVEVAETEAATLDNKLGRLRGSVAGKDELGADVRKAQDARACVQDLDDVRQRDEALRHEAELLTQHQEAEVAERARELQTLKDRIAQVRRAHERDVAGRRRRVAELTVQAEPLERVPCVGTELEGQCPLIEVALQAKAVLPKLEAELAAALELDPGAMDSKHLGELEAKPEGQQIALRLEEIAQDRAALAYDADDHQTAKQQAQRLPELQQKLAQIEAAEAQVAETESSLSEARAKATELADSKAALEAELGDKRNWDAMLSGVESTIAEAQRAIDAARAQILEQQQQRGGLQERLRTAEAAAAEVEELTASLRQAEKRLKLLKILAQAFGKAGIPALLIDQAVPDLEAVANDVLSVLSDGRMSLALETQRETKGKTLVETLDIIVSDEHGPRAYENFSGGEAMRVDLAQRIGLSMLLASRAGAQIEMLVCDETAAPLDAQGRVLFAESVQKAADRFATILVVSHVEELKDLFPYCFDVTKDAEGSHVELVAA